MENQQKEQTVLYSNDASGQETVSGRAAQLRTKASVSENCRRRAELRVAPIRAKPVMDRPHSSDRTLERMTNQGSDINDPAPTSELTV